MRPGPVATLMMNGMPANARFRPPGNCSTVSGTSSSFHSMMWCSKNTESFGAQMNFGDWNDFAFHLAGAGAELKSRSCRGGAGLPASPIR